MVTIATAIILVYFVFHYRKKAQDAETSLKAMDDFCLIAVHEIKTPITALRLQIRLLQRLFELKKMDQEYILNGLNLCSEQTGRMIKLIETFSEAILIKNNKIKLDPEPVNLSEVAESVVGQLKPLADSMGVEVLTEIEPNVIGTWDKCRIDQIVVNVLTNGIKYGNKKPVTVKVKQNIKQALYEVADNGIGVKPSDQKRIFNKFERVSSDKNGMGLGLYITKEIVDAHNGYINLNSNSGGTTFTIILPKSLSSS